MAHFQEEHPLRKDDVNCSKYVSKSGVGPDAFTSPQHAFKPSLFPSFLEKCIVKNSLSKNVFNDLFSLCHRDHRILMPASSAYSSSCSNIRSFPSSCPKSCYSTNPCPSIRSYSSSCPSTSPSSCPKSYYSKGS